MWWVVWGRGDRGGREEGSRWGMPGKHGGGGEKPTWQGRRHRLHHALRFGDELWAGLWHGGVAVIDIADIRKPRTLGSYNYHPPYPEPSHTFMPIKERIGGRAPRRGVGGGGRPPNGGAARARRPAPADPPPPAG